MDQMERYRFLPLLAIILDKKNISDKTQDSRSLRAGERNRECSDLV
jgi:hypothetical protein